MDTEGGSWDNAINSPPAAFASRSTAYYRGCVHAAGLAERQFGVAAAPGVGEAVDAHTADDNAMAKSFFSSLKNELVHQRDFAAREQAMMEIYDYIELSYNRNRIHQASGYRTPVEFEAMCNASKLACPEFPG